jgi:uncharacterized protein (DUF1697 family)
MFTPGNSSRLQNCANSGAPDENDTERVGNRQRALKEMPMARPADAKGGALHVALLRGVNVGGHKLVDMATLRMFMGDIGFHKAESVLQTGNLVFRADIPKDGGPELERLLEKEAEKRLGLKTDFFVRSVPEWHAIIAGNPFPDEAVQDPGRLVVMCLKDAPAAASFESLQGAITGPELVRAAGRNAYIYYPAGQGQSRFTTAVIDRTLSTRGTIRNWNTVLKLEALAGAMDGNTS